MGLNMAYDSDPKIPSSTEHIEQLAVVGQSAQDKRKSPQRGSKRRHASIEQALEEEQQARDSQDDGHVNYQA
jgi:hypothetical protein